jgi:hypothetical protein
MKTYQFLLTCTFIASASTSYASSLQLGDLLISEVLANPSAVSDSNGEYFELFNSSNQAINLNGFTISDDGSNLHIIDAPGPLLVQPGEYFVLGNNGDSSTNGGYIADYVYSDFSLTNSSDEIIVSNVNNQEIARLAFSGAPFGIAGISAELINQVLQPTTEDYALSTTLFGDGDLGSPGMAGSFALNNTTSPVPLPAAFWLFSSALFMLLRIKHQHSK